jgi:hypothetical protein
MTPTNHLSEANIYGKAGTAATAVGTVQGISGGTPVPMTSGTTATDLGKAEDAAHVTGDTGVMLLGIRESTNVDLSAGGTNGDYEPLELDATGRLWVHAGAIDAGETHIGEVGGHTIVVKPTITVDTGIYAALDVLGALVVWRRHPDGRDADQRRHGRPRKRHDLR